LIIKLIRKLFRPKSSNNKIIEALNLRKINSINILIIIKPTDYEEITKVIMNIKKASA